MLSRGVGAVQGWVVFITGSDIITPHPCGQTDRRKNITLPQTLFAGDKKVLYNSSKLKAEILDQNFIRLSFPV